MAWTEADVTRMLDKMQAEQRAGICVGGGSHVPGGKLVGTDLLGTALKGGMSLGTIGTYFPALLPAAKRRLASRKTKRSKRR